MDMSSTITTPGEGYGSDGPVHIVYFIHALLMSFSRTLDPSTLQLTAAYDGEPQSFWANIPVLDCLPASWPPFLDTTDEGAFPIQRLAEYYQYNPIPVVSDSVVV